MTYNSLLIMCTQFSKIVGEVSLLSGLSKPLLTQEECWEFFAENMAPFTSPSSAALMRSESIGGIMQAEQARGVIARFFASLATSLIHVETHKVGIIVLNKLMLRLRVTVRPCATKAL